MNSNKRKERPIAIEKGRVAKRTKGGSGGKWQTPHQQAKLASIRGRGIIEPGDVGIWATCARGQEGKATVELRSLLHKFAEKFYGIVGEAEEDDEEDEDDLDIEAAIQKEAAAIENQKGKPKLFTTARLDIECVLFVKVRPPIDPVDFVHRICKEVALKPDAAGTRYINRLTPMTMIGRATEKGLEEVGKTVLGEYFELNKTTENSEDNGEIKKEEKPERTSYSYAIRPTIRNHNTLKRDVVIKQIASSIADVHKVNLTKPDKVILVEIYQTICGMSVVGDDWETLKRFNLAELSKPKASVEAESKA
ncbi:tRNA acetyltransferase [Lachnellula hyalina]|uniref:tRNA acetyltransferase n=1 Tax=Lachnellula hyalina TaxID=1316788 RepID=A0A8H8TZK2_9HELO|nr:tRNA acetyltransferase [Lachnellula hyalina]TVY26440.1 tRNA acetyltransferase [Lachnellula hyalina]